jgi:hypothetical protein
MGVSPSRQSTGSGRRIRENGSQINEANYLAPTPSAHETVAVSSTAKSLTAAKYGTKAIKALIQVQGNPIRYWLDGTEPTSSVGFYCYADDSIELESLEEIQGFRAIRVGSDATLAVQYYE